MSDRIQHHFRNLAFGVGQLCLVTWALGGCATGEHTDDYPHVDTFATDTATGSSGSATEGLPEEGWKWCSDAPFARWWDTNNTYEVLDGDNKPPSGCQCAPAEIDAQLEAKLFNNQAYVTHQDNPDLILFREEVYQNGQAKCIDILDPSPAGYIGDNCLALNYEIYDKDRSTPSVLDPTPLYPTNTTCTLERRYEEYPGGCGFVDGSYGVTYSPSTGNYEIPQSTWDDFFGNPGCLLHEGGRIDFNSSSGRYMLTGVNRMTLLYELGLRSNDEFVSINRMPLDNVDDAFDAFDALRTATSWSLQIRRGGSALTLSYVVN